MPIYYDPSENREGTRLPQGVITAGRELIGLEKMTGADLLLSAADFPMPKVTMEMPRPLVNNFYDVTSHGILVQRKSGQDLLSSLDNLDRILCRMLDWVGEKGEAWLVSTGTIGEDKKGNVIIDGRGSKMRYTSLMSRLVLWQRRGGFYVNLPNDQRLVSFCSRWESSWLDKPELKVIRPRPQIILEAGWWHKLTLVPGLGLKGAEAIARWLPEGHKTFADGLQYLSWAGYYAKEDHPAGVGPRMMERTKEWLGLGEDESLQIIEKS